MGFFVIFLHIYHHDIIQQNVDWIYQFETVEHDFVRFSRMIFILNFYVKEMNTILTSYEKSDD